jgi:ubiquitin-protein ligase
MKINFDEQNLTKWEVLLDGPDQSVYAVRDTLGYLSLIPS